MNTVKLLGGKVDNSSFMDLFYDNFKRVNMIARRFS